MYPSITSFREVPVTVENNSDIFVTEVTLSNQYVQRNAVKKVIEKYSSEISETDDPKTWLYHLIKAKDDESFAIIKDNFDRKSFKKINAFIVKHGTLFMLESFVKGHTKRYDGLYKAAVKIYHLPKLHWLIANVAVTHFDLKAFELACVQRDTSAAFLLLDSFVHQLNEGLGNASRPLFYAITVGSLDLACAILRKLQGDLMWTRIDRYSDLCPAIAAVKTQDEALIKLFADVFKEDFLKCHDSQGLTVLDHLFQQGNIKISVTLIEEYSTNFYAHRARNLLKLKN